MGYVFHFYTPNGFSIIYHLCDAAKYQENVIVNLHLLPGSKKELKKAEKEMTTQFYELKICFPKSNAAGFWN